MENNFGFSSYENSFRVKNAQRRNLRKTASFIGIALIMVTLLGKVSARISLYIVNLFGAGAYVQNGVFYGGELNYWIVNILSSAITMFIPAVLLYFALGAPFSVKTVLKAPNPLDLVVSVPITLSATVVMGVVLNILGALFESAGVESVAPNYPQASAPSMLILYIVYMTVVPALFEETLFRGVIMTSLRRFGDVFAVVTSALLFGLIHGNALQFVNAFMLGLLLGYFAVRSGSIITSMVIHFFNNLLYCVLELAISNLPDATGYSATLFIETTLIVLGLLSLLLYFIKNKNNLKLINIPLMLTRNEKITNTFTALGMLAAVLFYICEIAFNFNTL